MSETNGKGSPTHEQIAARAYELFEERGAIAGEDVSHWLEAERELSAAPAAEAETRESHSKAEPKIVDSPISAPNITGQRSRATVA